MASAFPEPGDGAEEEIRRIHQSGGGMAVIDCDTVMGRPVRSDKSLGKLGGSSAGLLGIASLRANVSPGATSTSFIWIMLPDLV
jgi:hypothetical protein